MLTLTLWRAASPQYSLPAVTLPWLAPPLGVQRRPFGLGPSSLFSKTPTRNYFDSRLTHFQPFSPFSTLDRNAFSATDGLICSSFETCRASTVTGDGGVFKIV
ncbi:unnamed protein product [Macrosiphum euphorbiae]|uniref:Secreted protein n=1 Tax=Macrosiphum euphorbiae TaxID=13131 RepID=A0AAV0XWQ8_9HEMI|nr:unnamed protein product [Macrosiphum euphorbiae]